MQFYTKIGLTAIVITIIILIVLWYRGHFQSSELNTYSISDLQPVRDVISNAGNKSILTMDTNSGDIEMVSASNLNSVIRTLAANDNTMHAEFPQKILQGVEVHAQADAQNRVNDAFGFNRENSNTSLEFDGELTTWPAAASGGNAPKSMKDAFNQLHAWINANELHSQGNETNNVDWVNNNLAKLGEPYNIQLRGTHAGLPDNINNDIHNLYGSSNNWGVAYTPANDPSQNNATFALVNPSSGGGASTQPNTQPGTRPGAGVGGLFGGGSSIA